MVRAGLWVALAVAWSVGGTRVPPAGVPWARGVVGDRARVEVGLGHGVDGGAGRGLAGAEGRGQADRGHVGLVVADGDGADGHVAVLVTV